MGRSDGEERRGGETRKRDGEVRWGGEKRTREGNERWGGGKGADSESEVAYTLLPPTRSITTHNGELGISSASSKGRKKREANCRRQGEGDDRTSVTSFHMPTVRMPEWRTGVRAWRAILFGGMA